MDNSANFLEVLQRTQWFSPSRLDAYQAPLIDRLLRHAAVQTDFYPERLAPLFNGGDPATATIDHDRWYDLPIVRRTDLLNDFDRMCARQVPPETGTFITASSSGSTGRYVTTRRSWLAVQTGNLTLERAVTLWGVDLAATTAYITADPSGRSDYPEGGSYRLWSAPGSGMLSVLSTQTSIAEQLEWLERVRPANVMTHPFTMRLIAEYARERGSSLRFDFFIGTGEMLLPEVRDILSKTFGCRVIDIYAAREIGTIAFACTESSAYHICAETLICELLDDNGMPVAPGSYGRVVVTPLYNYAMPMIRYDTGDYALKSRFACACGRGLPVVDAIGGRSRSRLVMPDGSLARLRLPIFQQISEYLSYREIQLVQTAIDAIEVRYVPHDRAATPDVAGIAAILHAEYHPGLAITLTAMDIIPRGPGMKLELLISLIEPGEVAEEQS